MVIYALTVIYKSDFLNCLKIYRIPKSNSLKNYATYFLRLKGSKGESV